MTNSYLPNPSIGRDGIEQFAITEPEVENVLKKLNNVKASGPDLISLRLLKATYSQLKSLLYKIFMLSFFLVIFSHCETGASI